MPHVRYNSVKTPDKKYSDKVYPEYVSIFRSKKVFHEDAEIDEQNLIIIL